MKSFHRPSHSKCDDNNGNGNESDDDNIVCTSKVVKRYQLKYQ